MIRVSVAPFACETLQSAVGHQQAPEGARITCSSWDSTKIQGEETFHLRVQASALIGPVKESAVQALDSTKIQRPYHAFVVENSGRNVVFG